VERDAFMQTVDDGSSGVVEHSVGEMPSRKGGLISVRRPPRRGE
jgi:hypothetical protein